MSEERHRSGPTRRGFLKAASLSAASLAACQRLPVEHALPYLVQPEEITPGEATFYAGTCTACNAGCGLMSKVLDGRPVKLEGMADHPLSRGGLCAVGQGQLRELYDPGRLRAPTVAGEPVLWPALDRQVRDGLADLEGGRRVYVVSRTIVSPSARAAVERFLEATGGRLVEHDLDPQSPSALREAYELLVGRPLTPGLDLERTDVLVSFAADPLGTGPDPVVQAAAWAARRRDAHERGMPFHLQVESTPSPSGAAADERWRATPGERERMAYALLRRVARGSEGAEADAVLSALAPLAEPGPEPEGLERVAAALLSRPGRALVVSSANRLGEQLAVALTNRLLGAEGATLRLDRESLVSRGLDRDLLALRDDLLADRIGALFLVDLDLVGGLPGGDALAEALARVPLSVGIYRRANATSRACRIVAAAHHGLESWGDAEPRPGRVSLAQPAVRPLFETRNPWEGFLRWSGAPITDWRTFLRTRWQRASIRDLETRPVQEENTTAPVPPPGPLDAAWSEIVRTAGLGDPEAAAHAAGSVDSPAPRPLDAALTALADAPIATSTATGGGTAGGDAADSPDVAPAPVEAGAESAGGAVVLEVVTEVSGRAGQHAANPWLRELPDPLTRVSWMACVRVAPERAERLGLSDGDEIEIRAGGESVTLPALVLPGQHPDVVAVPLGYGDGTEADDCDSRGDLAAPLIRLDGGRLRHVSPAATLEPTGSTALLPLVQVHDDPEGRPVIHQVAHPDAAVHEPHHPDASLWPQRPDESPHWEMVIDTDACIGCGGCVVACQAENNIPVVGARLMAEHRDMHWLRIDRYVTGGPEQPDVVFQPMLCAQCDNAPCETVCPVAATVHGEGGLNQQAYNRCVGTRYCANNCPYKVRRFNWFDFQPEDPVERLMLNPDVVVRSRGVMEKCTFCVQRIQADRIHGRREGGGYDVQTACQQSCPTQAIRFGDGTDPEGEVARAKGRGRAFRVLAELGVEPSVTYLARVRNRPDVGHGADASVAGEEHEPLGPEPGPGSEDGVGPGHAPAGGRP